MFEAYITNTALYPLMGIEVGTTVHFPTTTQELQAALAKIGIDGKRYSEVFFCGLAARKHLALQAVPFSKFKIHS